ncbi:LPXTG cell wall anchor domain-containing protein [Streptomyces sp. ISL-12]|uniref:LPXTG cell wall anchor domain-containing protein n=1 Tax=Streptomyces sp. ISL-12 TaxID=2819177 RepID=UPI001BE7B117|nr:LPXTG cell wall anchor domain-containing protein [Streptomyces sp. ISL-12]MBT2410271.1 LPXTG cell wall anchor domain-containing protein [Streptomyces sp. ISL-12]
MVVAAAATSVLSLCGSPALAESWTDGPAVDAQAPSDAPAHVCDETVGGSAALNRAFGEACSHGTDAAEAKSQGGYGDEDEQASSGLPLDICGATDNLAGVDNYASVNICVEEESEKGGHHPGYGDDDTPSTTTPPVEHHTPPADTPAVEQPEPQGGHEEAAPPAEPAPVLAETGGDATTALGAAAGSVALIAGGTLLYRRSRAASRP